MKHRVPRRDGSRLHGAEADVVAGVFETRAKILLEAGGEFMRGFPGLGMNDVAEMNAYPDGEPGRGQEGDALGEIASLALDQDLSLIHI